MDRPPRRDELLAGKLSRGEVTAKEAEALTHYIDHGYVIFPKAVGDEVINAYLDLFERSWDEAPLSIYVLVERRELPISREFYDKITKVSSLHCCFDRAAELIFPSVVLRFLTLIYDRPPVAFQTMTMRKGSEETLHIDTGPLTLTEPMTMAASWLALEDVRPGSGELEFVPGSHSVPEYLHPSMSKGHNNDMTAYSEVLEQMKADCVNRGFNTERFAAKKGDILIWHADLLHGGAKIEDPSSTRKSLVTHFMPLGVMPTFFDSSEVERAALPEWRLLHRSPRGVDKESGRGKQRRERGAKPVASAETARSHAGACGPPRAGRLADVQPEAGELRPLQGHPLGPSFRRIRPRCGGGPLGGRG